MKNLTAEVAELAEVKLAKGWSPREQGKKTHYFQRLPEGQNRQEVFRK